MTTDKPEVKRYDCTSGGAQYCYGCYTMEEDELGYYVEWEAYEALKAECERLQALIGRMGAEIDRREIPDGWKLVPTVPTAAMGDAAMDAEDYSNRHRGEPASFIDIWDAMLDAAPAVQGEPVAFCEDAALSIAERTFSTDVDEQLASDIIQYAQRLHSLYAAPQPAEQQPAPDVSGLVEALERLVGDVERATHVEFGGTPWLKEKMAEIDYARAALAAYRKGGEK